MNIHYSLIIGLALTLSFIINSNILSSNIVSAVLFNDNLMSSNIDYSKNIDLWSLFRDNYQQQEEVGEDSEINSALEENYRSSSSDDSEKKFVFDNLPSLPQQSQQLEQITEQQNTPDDKYVVLEFENTSY